MVTKRELIKLLEEIDMSDDTPVRVSVIEPARDYGWPDHKAEGSVYEIRIGIYSGKKVIYVIN
jgi:hypothetical protein